MYIEQQKNSRHIFLELKTSSIKYERFIMHVTKVLKTEAKDGNTNEQEVVFILDNYIQISGIVVSFDEEGEFSGITWPENVTFLDTGEQLKVTADLVYKLSSLMQAFPAAFEENNYQGSKFGKYVKEQEQKILNKEY